MNGWGIMKIPKCKECYYCTENPYLKENYICRRYPKQLYSEGHEDFDDWYPTVDLKTDWCGEFKQIEENDFLQFYRKKPIMVAACQWTGENEFEIKFFFTRANIKEKTHYSIEDKELKIQTLEGVITASPGDYIIRGIKGEFYPCKPDIFAESYDEID